MGRGFCSQFFNLTFDSFNTVETKEKRFVSGSLCINEYKLDRVIPLLLEIKSF